VFSKNDSNRKNRFGRKSVRTNKDSKGSLTGENRVFFDVNVLTPPADVTALCTHLLFSPKSPLKGIEVECIVYSRLRGTKMQHALVRVVQVPITDDDDDGLGPLERACDIPFCMATEVPTAFGNNNNITCAKCHKFVCASCTEHTAKTASPVQDVPGMTIRTFTCPFCRAFFNEVLFY
jgi:hypothetical protein